MFYYAELEFLKKLLKNLNIEFNETVEGEPLPEKLDKGIREYLKLDENYGRLFADLHMKLAPNTIYKITDGFYCRYIMFILPDTEKKTAFIVGPYLNSEITRQMMINSQEKYNVSETLTGHLIKYYGNLSCIKEERMLFGVCNTLGEVMWGSMDNFTVENEIKYLPEELAEDVASSFKAKSDDALLSIRILEERYDAERRMMQAVSQGMSHKVEQMMNNATSLIFEKRADDPVRNFKNYLIITNTLMRKAAEQGLVHPYYIDGLSSEFAKKIEKIKTATEGGELIQEMARKYCALVKRHSMKNYSLPVQKVMTLIDTDLAADLTLRRLASLINVNASYLSALFKKETGKPLTEYVTRKRVEHAAYLLRSTSMQGQTVAQQCGILDVNYFAKMFKRYTGKTPKEYREGI